MAPRASSSPIGTCTTATARRTSSITDPSVFFFSTHQWPLYPGTGRANETGEGAGAGHHLNFPFPAGRGAKKSWAQSRMRSFRPLDDFRPELVLISAGFDSRIGDLLGGFTLTDHDFADLTARVDGNRGPPCRRTPGLGARRRLQIERPGFGQRRTREHIAGRR